MRRLTAALVLLALLLTGCVWSRRSVEKVCTEAAEALYAGELDRARAIWEEAQPRLGGLLFERLAAAHDGTDDENLLDRAELLARLHHLPEMEKASLRNIL